MRKTFAFLMIAILATALATAQTRPATATNPNNPNATQVARTDNYAPTDTRNNNNYSWLGLLGLLGLAGLKRRNEVARTHDANRTGTADHARTERFDRGRDDIRKVG